MSKRIYLETLGCAKNRVDTEIMMGALQQNGYKLTMRPDKAEVIVVNTCGFLSSASQESVNRILELNDYKQTGNCQKLVATGCLTQRYQTEMLTEIPELDGILGSSDFVKIPQLLNEMYEHPGQPAVLIKSKPHYTQYQSVQRVRSTESHVAYVKVSEGCSNMCSFCNIPSLRGYFSSRPIASIVEEIQSLVEQNVKEINIISQDTSSYGFDLKDGSNLAGLVKAISQIKGGFWVRLFYVYPNTLTREALEIMAADPRFCPYLDIPFQHISDHVLKDMNRRITQLEIREKMRMIQSIWPNVVLRTTFIVGFPTETAADFEELLDFVHEGHFEHVGVFTYSHEDNIRSAKFGDPIPPEVKQERKNRLMEAQREVSLARNEARIGQRMEVLLDGYSQETDLLLQGRSNFQGREVDGLIYINEGEGIAGEFHQVEITEAHPYDLVGRIVSPEFIQTQRVSELTPAV